MVTQWVRFEHRGQQGFGTLDESNITVYGGSLFEQPQRTGQTLPLAQVRLLAPCAPGKFIALWNNFHARAAKEGWSRPEHPLYFLKADNCCAAHLDDVRRPAHDVGTVVFEGELGIVIGKRCADIRPEQADDFIFGYTCVNDVTAREVLRSDPLFTQWSRAKSYDTFGPFGPCIASGIEPDALSVRTLVDGRVLQDYPVADMFFRPRALVALLSRDMTLQPGDLIACGTSLGAGPMKPGETVEVVIDGVGTLRNVLR